MIPKYKPYAGLSELLSLLDCEGNVVERFEQAFAAAVGSKYALAFPYGRSGLLALLESQGIRGAEVLIPAYTCIVVPNAILASGNIPRFVDIRLDNYNMDIGIVPSAMSGQTRAIVPAHMYGYPLDVKQLRDAVGDDHVLVFEDACLAVLSRDVGSYSDAAFYSLNLGKQLTTFDGGIVTTNHEHIYESLRSHRETRFTRTSLGTRLKKAIMLAASEVIFKEAVYGLVYAVWKRSGRVRSRTRNWSLSDTGMPKDYLESYSGVQARVGLAQLRKLDEIVKRRKEIAGLYDQRLAGVEDLVLPPIAEGATYSHYTVRTRDREGLVKALERRGIQAGSTFDYSIPHTAAYALYAGEGRFPNSAAAAREIVNLPVYPSLSRAAAEAVCDIVLDWTARRDD